MTQTTSRLERMLHANGPDPERSRELHLYGQFVGDWTADVVAYEPAGEAYRAAGEIHFGWVLHGRAVQDVWIIPPSDHSNLSPFPVAGNWYGTTIRAYDPTIQAWRIYWVDPATNAFRQQIGRAIGDDIVQEGVTESGALSRWRFTNITPETFHWLADTKLTPDSDWRVVVEVLARRI